MLNDRERIVLDCVLMRYNEKEALALLKAEGHEMSARSYWRIRGDIEATKQKRLFEIGQHGFEDQHLRRIDTLESVEKKLWREYVLESSPYRRAKILVWIAELQPWLGTFYRLTKRVIENQKPIEGTDTLSRLATI
jgi:hypothetical protein